jgi:multidrug transporter EmrE-like cation transporter
MKLSQGFTRPFPSFLIFIFYGLSFTLLTMVLKRMDVSIAYAIWSCPQRASWLSPPALFTHSASLKEVLLKRHEQTPARTINHRDPEVESK